jgi:selenocysteine lyase/cysteine desulfurase
MTCSADETTTSKEISRFVRSQFPYFSSQQQRHQQSPIFFENAGGAQVPQSVDG